MRSDFANRPLRDTRLDRERFVERPADVAALERALDLGFNVALIAPPGAGTTSLLEHLAARRPQAHRVNAEDVRSLGAALWAAARALGDEVQPPDEQTPPRTVLQRLRTAAARREREPELLVDGLDPGVAHELFGRLRDELWDLPARWVLAVRSDDRAVALMAPANAFFDAAHELRPFSAEEIETLLERRDGGGILSAGDVARIAELAGGSPARALGLARKGHLGIGADADVTIYPANPDDGMLFSYPRYVLKDGQIVVEEGEVREVVDGKEFIVRPACDETIEDYIRPLFEKVYTMSFANYPVEIERLRHPEVVKLSMADG
jgi:hypothetical protein